MGAHRVFITSIAYHISNFIINKQNENKKKLHAIYLINEILFKNYNPDTITVEFNQYLGVIHKAIYQFDDEYIQVQMRKLFTFWGDRKLFSLKTIGDNIMVAILPHLPALRVVVPISSPSPQKIEAQIVSKEQKKTELSQYKQHFKNQREKINSTHSLFYQILDNSKNNFQEKCNNPKVFCNFEASYKYISVLKSKNAIFTSSIRSHSSIMLTVPCLKSIQ